MTPSPEKEIVLYEFLLTCLLRGMTEEQFLHVVRYGVSTHMPLARHDTVASSFVGVLSSFYSHASCEA